MPKQFDVTQLHMWFCSQQSDEPFKGGQRMSAGIAHVLNRLPDIFDALREYQGGIDYPEKPAPLPPMVSRFAKPEPEPVTVDEPATVDEPESEPTADSDAAL